MAVDFDAALYFLLGGLLVHLPVIEETHMPVAAVRGTKEPQYARITFDSVRRHVLSLISIDASVIHKIWATKNLLSKT